MINQTIAHYKITSKLGQGGMGEVDRAADTKLDRDVAIKGLPESFAGDRNRIAQFKYDAKALVALNHANILAVTLALFSSLGMGAVDQSAPVFTVSPNGQLRIEVSLHNVGQAANAPHYCVFFGDREIVAHSRLGVELAGGTTLVIRRR